MMILFSKTRYILMCISIALTTITAGSIFTFPVFGPAISETLHLSMRKTNTIASIAILGQYFTAPFFGVLHPRLVALSAAILFSLGYALISSIMASHTHGSDQNNLIPDWILVAIFYCLCGFATTASFFSALLCSTQTFTTHPGLAIALPCTLFGLSPLFLSNLTSLIFSSSEAWSTGNDNVGNGNDEAQFNPVHFFSFLSVLLGIINLFGAIALKPITHHDHHRRHQRRLSSSASSISSDRHTPISVVIESDPLLHDSITTNNYNTNDENSDNDNQINDNENDNDESEGKQHAIVQDSPVTFFDVIKSRYFWLIGLLVFCLAGPCEMTLASTGSIVQSLLDNDTSQSQSFLVRSTQVSILSMSNTIIRLIAGALSDYLSPKYMSRLSWLIIAACIGTFSWAFTATFGSTSTVWVLSVGTGFTYGIAFTLCPSIVACKWPIESFGLVWGLLTYFSAAGAATFSLIYGALSDNFAEPDPDNDGDLTCHGRKCISGIYYTSSILAASCIIVAWRLKNLQGWKNIV